MQREDVYETNDLPESEQDTNAEEKFDSEHIEKVRLKVGDAYQHFKGKSLQTDETDFSDSIAKHRKGYSGHSFFVELIRPVGDEPETASQQYHRLQNEIKELAGKLEEIKANNKVLTDAEKKIHSVTASDVTELQQSLKQLQIEQVLGVHATETIAGSPSNLFSQILDSVEKAKSVKTTPKAAAPEKPITYELYCSSLGEDSKEKFDAKKLSSLESRLAMLEKLLGNESDKMSSLMIDAKARNMLELAENLQQRVTMLDSTQLDLVEARLSIVLHKLSQVKDKKSGIDAEQSGRVNELYEMMVKWDSLCSSLPQIVSRFQSLKELHEQALQFSQSITHLDGIQQELSRTLDTDVSLLNEVKDTFTKNLDVFKTNCETIEKRLKALSTSK